MSRPTVGTIWQNLIFLVDVFVLAVLQQLEPKEGEVQAIVMCHTRELAFQITHEFERFSSYLPDVKVTTIFGGVSIKAQKEDLKTTALSLDV